MGSSSPTRDGTQAPCIGSTESQPLDHQGSPPESFLISSFSTLKTFRSSASPLTNILNLLISFSPLYSSNSRHHHLVLRLFSQLPSWTPCFCTFTLKPSLRTMTIIKHILAHAISLRERVQWFAKLITSSHDIILYVSWTTAAMLTILQKHMLPFSSFSYQALFCLMALAFSVFSLTLCVAGSCHH